MQWHIKCRFICNPLTKFFLVLLCDLVIKTSLFSTCKTIILNSVQVYLNFLVRQAFCSHWERESYTFCLFMSVNRYECVWKKNGEVYTSDILFNILTLSYLSLSTSKGFFNLEHLLFITETKNIKNHSFLSVCIRNSNTKFFVWEISQCLFFTVF